MAGLKQLNWASEGVGATAAALVDLSTVAGNKISNPPWVKFQSAGWVNFPSAPTEFKKYDLNQRVIYSCNDTQAMLAMITAGIGVGFVPEWVKSIPGQNFELREVDGLERYIGLGLAWSVDDPTVNRDSIIELCRSLIDSEA